MDPHPTHKTQQQGGNTHACLPFIDVREVYIALQASTCGPKLEMLGRLPPRPGNDLPIATVPPRPPLHKRTNGHTLGAERPPTCNKAQEINGTDSARLANPAVFERKPTDNENSTRRGLGWGRKSSQTIGRHVPIKNLYQSRHHHPPYLEPSVSEHYLADGRRRNGAAGCRNARHLAGSALTERQAREESAGVVLAQCDDESRGDTDSDGGEVVQVRTRRKSFCPHGVLAISDSQGIVIPHYELKEKRGV